jgi:hypothetical protein
LLWSVRQPQDSNSVPSQWTAVHHFRTDNDHLIA